MLRQVVGDLYQVGESVAGKDGWHEAVRVYVALNDGAPLLFDAGSHLHREPILRALKELLGEAVPVAVFLTHTELPHTGNLGAILEQWPRITFTVSSGILPHVELPWWVRADQVRYAHPGSTETYGGRSISFSDGILKDQPGTQWLFDEKLGALFTADAFGYLFPLEGDRVFDDEMEDGVPTEWFRRYHEAAFRFLPMVSGHRVNADLDRVFSKRGVRAIAPTHGNAIRGNVALHVDRVKQAMLEICG